MPKYLLSVFGPAERNQYGDYPDKESMLQAFADTGAFNDKLVAEGKAQELKGEAQKTVGDVKDGAKNLADKVSGKH